MSAELPSVEVVRLEAEHSRPAFSCGDDDIDEFFHKDSIASANELVSVTYVWHEKGEPVAFFSVSNDAISRESCPTSAFKRIQRLLPHEKRYSSLPAVKIGRIGVSRQCRRTGCGSRILEFLKIWFVTHNKTGCRFIVVDAYNDAERIGFYQKNGFVFLTDSDKADKTRIMYYDLLPFTNAQEETL